MGKTRNALRTRVAGALMVAIASGAIADSDELVGNGRFDGFEGWFRFKSTGFEPLEDVGDDARSGAAFIETKTSNFSAVFQRITLANDAPLALSFSYRIYPGSEDEPDAVRVFFQHLGPECASNVNNVLQNDEYLLQPIDSAWRDAPFLAVVTDPPAETVCTTLQFSIGNPAVDGYYFDNVSLLPLNVALERELIFIDGLEPYR
ncbi:MAG: hypothetical protein AAGE01_15890 [Pseudomonadota bacterium]